MKKAIYIFFMILMAHAIDQHGAAYAEMSHDRILRILIADDVDSIPLALRGRYTIYALNSDAVLKEGPYLKANVSGAKDGIRLGDKIIPADGIRVKVLRDSNIYVDERRFRGDVGIIKKSNGKLAVINYVPLEDYLYGVLYHEVSHYWPMEALKAQAIASRTFAMYQAMQNRSQPYDLRNDIYSQVYGGRTSEKWATSRAVDITRGMVLTYKGDIIPAYYHATCAGHTEDAVNLWNIDAPYLKGVQCGYCRDSKHYRWTKKISLLELADKLKDGGYKIGKIASVKILSKNVSGRVDKIEIKDEAGTSVTLTGKDFRQLIGPNELRSTKFDVSIRWGTLDFDGRGWGHGVGMCQWGAFGMAKRGKRTEEILEYYYPGTDITMIDKLRQ